MLIATPALYHTARFFSTSIPSRAAPIQQVFRLVAHSKDFAGAKERMRLAKKAGKLDERTAALTWHVVAGELANPVIYPQQHPKLIQVSQSLRGRTLAYRRGRSSPLGT